VKDWLQGTAHCRKDRGFLFLHNPTQQARAARIPLNHWLGLTQGEQFTVRSLHPQEKGYGRYRRGEELVIPVEPGQTLVLEIRAATVRERGERPKVPTGLPAQKAFLTLEETIALLTKEDFWLAAPLPGKGKMPSF
jgi:hypothetical protein